MGDFESAPSSKERIFGDFFHDLEKGTDRHAVVGQYVGAFPQWAAEFREEAALESVLVSSQPLPSAGDVELPDFRLIREIARGGMGIVYEADQLSLKRRVAVKVRRGRLAPSAHDRFQIEQQVLAQLHQTHIVPIHTAGQAGPWQYFAMAYIEGAALHRVVRATRNSTSRFGPKTPTLAGLAGEVLTASRQRAPHSLSALDPAIGFKSTADDLRVDGPHHDALDAKEPGATCAKSTQGLILSHDYFRSVASVIADAAEALQHAHDAHILHRDVKPSNIMVDTSGQCWLIDFGLARLRNGQARVKAPAADREESTTLPLTQGALGTPQYMAPEQYQEKADARSDIWGLAVTLYELLALSPAFEGSTIEAIHAKVVNEEPRPPQSLVRNVPGDLAAICRKAMQKNPDHRYQTAEAFADDLQRWLRFEPTAARPAQPLRRVSLWARRNKGWATVILTSSLAILISALLTIALFASEASHAKKEAARSKRESLLEQLQHLQLMPHHQDWSRQAWRLVQDIGDLAKDDVLKDRAVASLRGVEAAIEKSFSVNASSVALDASGQSVLLGGINDQHGRAREVAKLWEAKNGKLILSKQPGKGPVTFGADGAPLQLVLRLESKRLLLWNIARQLLVKEWVLPLQDEPLDWLREQPWCTCLTSDGSLVAVSGPFPDPGHRLLVWEAVTGKAKAAISFQATSLAISPDNRILACGNAEGEILLWSLQEDKEVARLPGRRLEIQSLTFGRDVWNSTSEKQPLLAAGDTSGTIVIWELQHRLPRTICRGSPYRVDALAFSPDGTTLASGGRYGPRVWDVATGKSLLNLVGGDFIRGLSFSADGTRLAVADELNFAEGDRRPMSDILRLEDGRGIQTLRGLASVIDHVAFSTDGRFVAALAHGSDIGVWNRSTGSLLHILRGPPILWTDNAALRFSPDGRKLAVSGCELTTGHAMVWDTLSGQELLNRNLAAGLGNRLAFLPDGKLHLLQTEMRDGKRMPGGGAEGQLVCRLHELTADGDKLLREIDDFRWSVFCSEYVPAKGLLVVDGYTERRSKRAVRVYEVATAKVIHSWPSQLLTRSASQTISVDPSGSVLAFISKNDDDGGTIVELPSGQLLEQRAHWDLFPQAMSAQMEHWLGGRASYWRRQNDQPLARLDLDTIRSSRVMTPDGRYVAWGNDDGTVNVCDMEKIQHKLNEARMGW